MQLVRSLTRRFTRRIRKDAQSGASAGSPVRKYRQLTARAVVEKQRKVGKQTDRREQQHRREPAQTPFANERKRKRKKDQRCTRKEETQSKARHFSGSQPGAALIPVASIRATQTRPCCSADR